MTTLVAPRPPLGRRDEPSLWRRAAAGDRTAREELVQRYVPLARMLARRYMRTSEPLEDLEQVASLGLVQAVDRFDADRGIAFSSFAVPTILGEIKRHFRDRTWALRVPRVTREAAIVVEKATARLATELGRMPSGAEVADETGLGLEAVLEAREAVLAYRTDSLDKPVHSTGEEGTATLGERLGANDEALRQAEDALLIDQLAGATLTSRDREVVRLRFAEDLLQREIAERVGLSQMHVSRILRDAVARMAEHAVPAERT